MKTAGEYVHVESIAKDERGDKIEPEEQRAIETTKLPIDVTLADHAVRPGAAPSEGKMAGSFGIASTAGDVAQSVATRCELCAYWRHDDWTRHLTAIEDTYEGRRMIDALRGELLGHPSGGIITRGEGVSEEDYIAVSIAIRREFGICSAFTESEGMIVASPHYGGCPENDVRFKMRDREAQSIASDGYDKILRLAQGRKE